MDVSVLVNSSSYILTLITSPDLSFFSTINLLPTTTIPNNAYPRAYQTKGMDLN